MLLKNSQQISCKMQSTVLKRYFNSVHMQLLLIATHFIDHKMTQTRLKYSCSGIRHHTSNSYKNLHIFFHFHLQLLNSLTLIIG